MSSQMKASPQSSAIAQYDAIIIGAGVSGLYQLYCLREAGFSVRVFEDGGDLGGTWYWNRYPGARFDSESQTYAYSFSKELVAEWNWNEAFSPQPDNLRYLDFVAKKFDLRKDIQFNSRVKSAIFDEASSRWNVELEDGTKARARFLISAMGILSTPLMPNFPGMDSFRGESFHTSRWPQDPNGFGGRDVGFAGKRVGVIGTGATAIQLIPEVAKTAAHLTVFQRTPNYAVPLRNFRIDDKTQAEFKTNYDAMFKRCNETFSGMIHEFDPRSALEVTPAEREALFEKLYNTPGFALWLGNFSDIMSNPEANRLISEFVANKIRQRVKDPKLAEKLVPRDHGFGLRRVPMETGYYETFNQPNVTLVDVRESPIQRITPNGIQTGDREYELDIIIYATGFDAVTGALTAVDIRGVGGMSLKDKWAEGPKTFLGLQTSGFPNFFMLFGPQVAFSNYTRGAEQNADFVTGLVRHMGNSQFSRVEATKKSEEDWNDLVNQLAYETLLPKANSWFMGDNVPGKKRSVVFYFGGSPAYRAKCEDVVAKGYEGFELQ
ncbi:MAG: NAD(P)/FAD-dependent oxidoreductase [Alphaproteobacteria bacterium]|nr:NAD(P)/FAD-dependent oxidoreductase [Alphaproteobacteria bacterium]